MVIVSGLPMVADEGERRNVRLRAEPKRGELICATSIATSARRHHKGRQIGARVSHNDHVVAFVSLSPVLFCQTTPLRTPSPSLSLCLLAPHPFLLYFYDGTLLFCIRWLKPPRRRSSASPATILTNTTRVHLQNAPRPVRRVNPRVDDLPRLVYQLCQTGTMTVIGERVHRIVRPVQCSSLEKQKKLMHAAFILGSYSAGLGLLLVSFG